MNETPVAPPPFQYSISDDEFEPLKEGVRLGCTSAALLALVYAIGIPVLFVAFQPFFTSTSLRDVEVLRNEIANLYSASLAFVIMAYIIGIGPAVIVGGLSGLIIGYIFQFFIPTRLSFFRAVVCGFCISFCMLVLRLWFVWEFRNAPPVGEEITDFILWVAWLGPNIVAFFALWWVVYKVNTKMQTL